MTEALQFCDRLAVNAFDLYIIVRLFRAVFKDRLRGKGFLCAAISVNMIVRLLESYFVPYIWVNIITNILLVFMLAGCYESPVWKRAGVTVGTVFLLSLSEIVTALVVGIDHLSFLDTASNGESFTMFLSRIFFLILVTLLLKMAGRDRFYKLPAKVAALETAILLVLGSEFLFLCVGQQESIVTKSMALLTAEITFYLMIYLQDCLTKLLASREQACLMEQEKEYYQREAAMTRQKQEFLRQFQHDLKNRLQVLNEIARRGNMVELEDYLWEIEGKYKEQELFSNTGNLIIDSIINCKLQDAAEKGIQVEASIALPAALEVKTDDMVVILGNLLDNAIEACERTDSARYIRLSMNYEKGCVMVSVKNSFDQIVCADQGELATRKKDRALHGLGIKSVKNTVEKYCGIAEFTSAGAEFSADILLYL